MISLSARVLLVCFASILASCSRLPEDLENGSVILMEVAPGSSIGLARLEGRTHCVLERIGDVWSPGLHQPVAVSAAAPLRFLGWAVDIQGKSVAGGVDIVIDGMPWATKYGLGRGDVADFLKVPAYRDSGFEFLLPTYKLDKGRHKVTFRVVNKEGVGFYELNNPVEFELR